MYTFERNKMCLLFSIFWPGNGVQSLFSLQKEVDAFFDNFQPLLVTFLVCCLQYFSCKKGKVAPKKLSHLVTASLSYIFFFCYRSQHQSYGN